MCYCEQCARKSFDVLITKEILDTNGKQMQTTEIDQTEDIAIIVTTSDYVFKFSPFKVNLGDRYIFFPFGGTKKEKVIQ